MINTTTMETILILYVLAAMCFFAGMLYKKNKHKKEVAKHE